MGLLIVQVDDYHKCSETFFAEIYNQKKMQREVQTATYYMIQEPYSI